MAERLATWDVVGVGANSTDYVNVLPAWPEQEGPRSKMRVVRRLRCSGGQTATALATCARLGLRAKYVGCVGNDDNGRAILADLAGRRVDVADVAVGDAPNGSAVILIVETRGERIVLWDRDDRLRLPPGHLRPGLFAGARLVHVDDGDTETALEAAGLAGAAGIPVTSDIDKTVDGTPALVAAVTFPIFAEHVPAALTGVADMEAALRRLRAVYPQRLTVTLGPRGAVALEGDAFIREPAFAVDVVDTTGAGDIFRAGFIYATLHGYDARQTLRFANAAGAASCQRLGAMASAPSLEDVRNVLNGPTRG
jgi:sulfofructose kinase